MRTVLGHEAGHILSDHVLYRTALIILLQLSAPRRLPMLAGIPLLAIQLALLEWFRCAELSCDRAATLVNRDPLVTCRTMMVLAGGTSRAQARPRRVHPPGGGVRGVELGLGQAQPHAHRADAHPQLPRAPRQGDHGLGAFGRVRPDRRRRVPDARPAGRRAQGGRRRGRVLQAAVREDHEGRRAPTRRGERIADAAEKVADAAEQARGVAREAAPGGAARWPAHAHDHHGHGHAHSHAPVRRTPTAAGWASRSA